MEMDIERYSAREDVVVCVKTAHIVGQRQQRRMPLRQRERQRQTERDSRVMSDVVMCIYMIVIARDHADHALMSAILVI